MKRPCDNCPWRKDSPKEFWHPDHFLDIWKECQDDGLHIMLCHKATKAPPSNRGKMVCQGWVRVMGFDAIGVRFVAAQGIIKPEQVDDVDGLDLFESFEAMMNANGVKIPSRNRRTPLL